MSEDASQALMLAIDAADPSSLANILPPVLADQVRDLPRELLIQDEVTLETMVTPTAQQKRIKIQFWDEYEEAVKQKRVMSLSSIVFGVCTRDYFLEFTRIKRNVAWLITPRPSYKVRVAEMIDKGLDKIEEIFMMDASDPRTATSVRNLQLAALRMLDLRKHGGYTQRVENKSLTLTKNLDTPAAGGSGPTGEGSIEELEQQVKELESKIAAGKNQNGALLNVSTSEVIDITPRTASNGSEESSSSEV